MPINRAILLLAGRGSRMGELTKDYPKCMLPVGEQPILGRTLSALSVAGVSEIVAVVGYKPDTVRDFLDRSIYSGRIRYVLNPDFATTNTAYSLSLAEAYLNEPCLLVEGDILFGRETVQRLSAVAADRALWCAIKARPNANTGIMLSRGVNGTVRSVALLKEPEREPREFEFKCAGIQRLTGRLAVDLRATLLRWAEAGQRRMFADLALAEAMRGHSVQLCSLDGVPWCEVDSHEDLLEAERIYTCAAPAIQI